MTEPNPPTTLKQRAVHVAEVGVFLLVIATVLALLGGLVWLFELATHFKVVYAVVGFACTAGCAFGRSRRWAIVGGVVTAWHLVGIAPYVPYAERSTAEPNLSLLSANVLTSNTNKVALIDHVKAAQPDVVLLQEVDTAWVEAFDEHLAAEYPHTIARPRMDNYGVAVYSRLPFVETAVIWQSGVPAIHVAIEVDRRAVSILNYHTVPPVTPDYAQWRNEQLDAIAEYRSSHPGPTIVAGDLNCTMWSTYFERLLRGANLVDTRKGRGLMPTWFPLPILGALLPVDHILVSPDIEVIRLERLSDFGSDHLPMLAELKL